MKIRPLHDRVIIKRLDEDKTSPGGIIIPDTAAEKPVQGKVSNEEPRQWLPKKSDSATTHAPACSRV